MEFELKSIDDGNSGTYSCAPQLEVAGDAISTIEINQILLVEPGYTRKDAILTIELKTSIQNDDETYPLEKNSLYEFFNSSIIKNLRIINFYEQSDVTIIKVYDEKVKLTDFFGILESKILTNYKMEIYDSFKVSDIDECIPPQQVEFFGVTSNSIKIKPIFDFNFIEEWNIRYRVISNTGWNIVSNIVTSTYELGDLLDNTQYEIEIFVKCNKNLNNSDFSETFLFRTI